MAKASKAFKINAGLRPPWLVLSPAKIVVALIVIFFAAQAFTGKQGLLSWRQYTVEAEALEIEKTELMQRKARLKDAVSRLSSAKADPDYIEERAVKDMNMANPSDFEIKIPPQPLKKTQN